ncbi:unnamed protein product [Bursaphelenchus okinawaensis]|uniref:Uncharacterized protein n=1 Tax=Bursaphelenchus okinawaensis TaxID=465554 RepID=A0A811KUW5_9BILA|nr:unnamed protein product [Bursaphelenchus okinawaensis]CAG9113678.1 unnamed protein product [Bursaphelenchus okinawaensis]
MGKVFILIVFIVTCTTIVSACCCCDCCCCDCCCCCPCCCCCCCKKKSSCPPGLILNSTRARRNVKLLRPQTLDELEANRARIIAERKARSHGQGCGSSCGGKCEGGCGGTGGCVAGTGGCIAGSTDGCTGCTMQKRDAECKKCENAEREKLQSSSSEQLNSPSNSSSLVRRECNCKNGCTRPARVKFHQLKPTLPSNSSNQEEFKWKSINQIRQDEYKERLRLVAEEQNAREEAERNGVSPTPKPKATTTTTSTTTAIPTSSTFWPPNVQVKEVGDISYEPWSEEDDGKSHRRPKNGKPKKIRRPINKNQLNIPSDGKTKEIKGTVRWPQRLPIRDEDGKENGRMHKQGRIQTGNEVRTKGHSVQRRDEPSLIGKIDINNDTTVNESVFQRFKRQVAQLALNTMSHSMNKFAQEFFDDEDYGVQRAHINSQYIGPNSQYTVPNNQQISKQYQAVPVHNLRFEATVVATKGRNSTDEQVVPEESKIVPGEKQAVPEDKTAIPEVKTDEDTTNLTTILRNELTTVSSVTTPTSQEATTTSSSVITGDSTTMIPEDINGTISTDEFALPQVSTNLESQVPTSL